MWTGKAATGASVMAASAGATAAPAISWLADPWIMAVCAVGIPIGVLARVAVHIEERKPPEAIKRDLWVSAFLALTNFILAVMAATWFALSPLLALAVSIGIAASGSMILLEWIKKLRLKLWPATDWSEGDQRQQDQKLLSAVKIALREQKKLDDNTRP